MKRYLAALREYEVEQMEKYADETTPPSEETVKGQAESENKSEFTLSSRFSPLVSEEDILKKIHGAIPKVLRTQLNGPLMYGMTGLQTGKVKLLCHVIFHLV